MNFYEGVEVVFGTLSASAEVHRLGATHTLVQRSSVVWSFLGIVLVLMPAKSNTDCGLSGCTKMFCPWVYQLNNFQSLKKKTYQ